MGRPIAILRDEDVGRAALAEARATKRPVRVRVAAGHRHIGLTDCGQCYEARGESHFLVHELVADERRLRPILEMVARYGGEVDELVGSVASSLARTDQGDLMIAAQGDLLSDGLEYDLGPAAEAVQTRQREKYLHGLAMFDPDAERAEQLADGMQHLRKTKAQLRALSAQHSSERPP